jgi:Putative Actinobacterial Holin-X, holin superfamily III
MNRDDGDQSERPVTMQSAKRDEEEPDNQNQPGGLSVSKPDRKNADKNGVPRTLTTIPLTDPHALSVEPSIGELVKDATAQMSTLVRAEVELARSEITRDVKKGLTGSVYFISALVVGFYSTFFFFFFLAELLDTWLWRWVAFLIVFAIMVVFTAVLALFGYLKVRRIRGPQRTIESVKETRAAFTPGHDKDSGRALSAPQGGTPADPSGW